MEKTKIWYEKFKELATEPMSRELSMIFITLIQKEHGAPSEEMVKDFSYRVANARAIIMGLKLTTGLIMLVTYLSNGNPGNIVMYLFALRIYRGETGKTENDISDLVSICPMGFPSEDSLSVLWDMQKNEDHTNMVDSYHE